MFKKPITLYLTFLSFLLSSYNPIIKSMYKQGHSLHNGFLPSNLVPASEVLSAKAGIARFPNFE